MDKEPQQIESDLAGIGRGDVFSDMGRVSELKLGKYELKNVISAMFPKEDVSEKLPALLDLGCNGLIGIEVMSQFNMIFDYSRNRLYLKPNKNYGVLFELNMAGMVVR